MTDLAIPEDRLALIKRTVCPGTDDELQLFLHYCNRTGLDPLSRQIYAIFRNENVNGQWTKRMTIQVGIDGFRCIAERKGGYAGQLGPFWAGEQSNWEWRELWPWAEPPAAAKVTALRANAQFTAVAHYAEYAQTDRDGKPLKMWKQMPANMLAKCAEALALRKAFPNDLSGIYTPDEFPEQSRNTDEGNANGLPVREPSPGGDTIKSATAKVQIADELEAHGFDPLEARRTAQQIWGDRNGEITRAELQDLLNQAVETGEQLALQ